MAGLMTRARLFLILGVVFLVLILGGAGGVWWYLFGANAVQCEDLAPGDTVAFASIPNAMKIVAGYQTSQLKQIVDSPNTQPLIDEITKTIGQKNLDVINAFLPCLSGQSFVAVGHIDVDHPANLHFIAAMKPKAGTADFDAFVEKVKATWPDELKAGTTGTGNVAGVDYQWIQGPGAPDKVCVAKVQGWIVTTWGEASLQDFIERLEKKSTTPSLAQSTDFQKSLGRVGKDPMTLLYVNYHIFIDLLQKEMSKTNAAQADYLSKKFGQVGGLAIGSRFENGEIVDRYSFLIPRQAQLEGGMCGPPCPFETLQFTGGDTRFYMASSVDWKQMWKNFQDQTNTNPMGPMITGIIQSSIKAAGLDLDKNIIDALGNETSIQVEWSADSMIPEAGLFIKLDKPDDFKPTIDFIIEAARKAYINSAVIKEVSSGGHNFASLQFVQVSPISPTITKDGPYLGLFLTPNQAVRSFLRDGSTGLTHNADFQRQIGDKRNGASAIVFLDTPALLDRAYRAGMPYLSMASMFNKNLAAVLNGKQWPQDLTWLAPIGTWSAVSTPDDDGVQGYSVSGVGNQGIALCLGLGVAAGVGESMGLFPKPTPPPAPPIISPFPTSAIAPTPAVSVPPNTPPAGLVPTAAPTPEVSPVPSPTAGPSAAVTPTPEPSAVTTPTLMAPTPTIPDASAPTPTPTPTGT